MKEPGYVYILTNPSFREDWVKIGKSSRPVDIRSKELDNTAVPLPFEIFATMKTTKYSEAEKLIHRYIERFTKLRIRDNREFFNVKPEVALEIFRDVAMILEDAEIEETYKKDVIGSSDSCVKHHSTRTPERSEKKVWMIPANSKFFDLAGCIAKYGSVYWTQHYNFQKGDICYIYSASPDSAVRYKCVFEGHDLAFSEEMTKEVEFNVNPSDFESFKTHNRFALLSSFKETTSEHLTLPYLMEHGMKTAPRGALNLSHPDFADLLEYIEDNF